MSVHSANWVIIWNAHPQAHKLSDSLHTGVFRGASGDEGGRVPFHRLTQKLYPLAPLIHNLLIFAFRRNPSHICKCTTTENKLWHRWCAQSLKPNTRGGNECVWLTLTWSQISTTTPLEVSPHSSNNNPWRRWVEGKMLYCIVISHEVRARVLGCMEWSMHD